MKSWKLSVGARLAFFFILSAAVTAVLVLGTGKESAAPVSLPVVQQVAFPGRYESLGLTTVGCALFDPETVRPYGPDDDYVRFHDFAMMVDNDNLFLIVARGDGVVTVTGEQCGISIDWRRLPLLSAEPGD